MRAVCFEIGTWLNNVPMRVAGAVAVVVAACLAGAAVALAGGRAAEPPTHVTLIGDSVATSLVFEADARAAVGHGVDMDLEVAACRRLVDSSCAANTPSTQDVIQSLGTRLGRNVVIVGGYNELEDRYAAAVETTLKTLEAANVDHVFWLTLRAARHPYVNMNDDLEAAAAKHPEVTVIDWNVYSRSHPDWFQDDGLHLLSGGALAMAQLIHDKLVGAGVALQDVVVKTRSLPDARRGKPYRAQLQATGGRAPYAWSLAGRLPPGLHLRPTGALWGAGRSRPGTFTFAVKAMDGSGDWATRTLVLRLR
jgi:Putative Ig domain